MTETLPSRVSALRVRLTILDGMASDVQETSLLTGLSQELGKGVDGLDRALTQCRVLVDGGVKVAMPDSLNVARSRAATLHGNFSKDAASKTLKNGTHWTNLIKALSEAVFDLGNLARSAWRDHRGVIFTGEAPAVIRSRMAGTERNQAALRRYEIKHQALRSAFETLPQRRGDIEQAKLLAKELTEIAGEFDFNVPVDVKAFLDAVQAGGAPLGCLTPAVIAWLKDNNAFDSYRIVPGR